DQDRARLGPELARFDHVVEHGWWSPEDVEWLARVDALEKFRAEASHHAELITGLALELGSDDFQHGGDRPGGEDFQLGGFGGGHGSDAEKGGQKKNRADALNFHMPPRDCKTQKRPSSPTGRSVCQAGGCPPANAGVRPQMMPHGEERGEAARLEPWAAITVAAMQVGLARLAHL